MRVFARTDYAPFCHLGFAEQQRVDSALPWPLGFLHFTSTAQRQAQRACCTCAHGCVFRSRTLGKRIGAGATSCGGHCSAKCRAAQAGAREWRPATFTPPSGGHSCHEGMQAGHEPLACLFHLPCAIQIAGAQIDPPSPLPICTFPVCASPTHGVDAECIFLLTLLACATPPWPGMACRLVPACEFQ